MIPSSDRLELIVGRMRLQRIVAALLVVTAAAASPADSPAAGPKKPAFAVTAFVLGIEGGSITTPQLVAALADGDWCTPRAVAATRWNQRPPAAGNDPWVSVVVTGFGNRGDALAFVFPADGSAPRLAARVPYGKSYNAIAATFFWSVPIGWIASGIRDYVETTGHSSVAAPRVVGLVVRRPSDAPKGGKSAGGLERRDEGTADLSALSGTRDASNVDAVRATAVVEALVTAAMLENGLAPGPADAEDQIEVEPRFGVKEASFRVARRGEAAVVERVGGRVPEGEYLDHLIREMLVLATGPGVGPADSFRPDGSGPLRFLAATPGRIALATGEGLAIFDAASGGRVFPSPGPQAKTHAAGRYVDRAAAPEAGVFRIDGGLSRIDPASGAATPLAAAAPHRGWAFAVTGGGSVVASDRGLSLFRGGTAAAWRHDEAASITAGPAVNEDRVFAGLEDGGLVCRSLADGAERWRKGTPQENWHGPMACLAGRVLAYDRVGRSLTAFDAADGRVAWKQPLGDVLLEPPTIVGERIIVAAKNNRVLALVPSDGTIAAEVLWPTWLTDIVVIPGGRPLVACADIHGSLAFLDAATLKPVNTVRLPTRLSGPLLFQPAFPSSWGRPAGVGGGDADEFADELDRMVAADSRPIAAVLATDVEGFCYVVRVPTP